MKKKLTTILSLGFALMLALGMTGCGSNGTATEEPSAEPVEVHVASLKGPTSIGLVPFMQDAEAGETTNQYDFTIAGAADEVVPQVIQGDIDIALIPANAASVLYNKTQGAVSVVDVNTLGVLFVVTGDEDVQGFGDLAGRTVYLTGKGTTPEYTVKYLLAQEGMTDDVTLEFKSEATEVVAALAQDPGAVAILPQPYVTAACAQNDALSAPVSLTEVWDEVATDGSQLVTGVTVVRTAFLEEHPEAVAEFVERQAASVEAVNASPDAYAQGVVDAGIIENAQVAAKAIPGCNLVCLTGEEMQQALSGYLQVLYDADASSVGGELPADGFYCLTVG